MADQAEALRQLVQRTDSSSDRSIGHVVVVVGARPSVGATTVSENLALAFRRENRPTVLVDADLDAPELLPRWGFRSQDCLTELMTGRRTAREVLQPGPSGLQLMGGCARSHAAVGIPGAGAALAGALQRLARRYWLVIDAGGGQVWDELTQLADVLLVVTTTESECLRMAYVRCKTIGASRSKARIWSVVNQANDVATAQAGQSKLQLAADRFLNLEVCAAGTLPMDPRIAEVDPRTRGGWLLEPRGQFGREMERIAVRMAGQDRGHRRVLGGAEEKSEKAHRSSRQLPITSPSLSALAEGKM